MKRYMHMYRFVIGAFHSDVMVNVTYSYMFVTNFPCETNHHNFCCTLSNKLKFGRELFHIKRYMHIYRFVVGAFHSDVMVIFTYSYIFLTKFPCETRHHNFCSTLSNKLKLG